MTSSRLTKTVYKDLNGNGEYDENDLYGLSACSVCIDCFWISSGVRFISKDAEDGLTLSIDEKVYKYVGENGGSARHA